MENNNNNNNVDDDNNNEEQDEQQSRFDYVRTITAQNILQQPAITSTLRPVVADQTINKMSKNINHNTYMMDAAPNNNNNNNVSMK